MMDETTGTEIDASTEAPESSGPVGETTEQQTPNEESGGNPAWDSLRSKLDPVSFHSIQEDLKNFDKNAESRISSLNQQLKQYNELGSPEQLQNYAAIAQRLDTEPEVIYNALGEFLKQNGRLPNNEAELQDAVDEEEATNESESPVDPRLAQLEQQTQQMQEFLAQQEQMRVQQEADTALEQEINELKNAHPDFSEDDVREVLMRAAFQLQSTGKTTKLSDVAQEYVDKTVNRIRAVPRPGDSAPRLLPTSGGMPGGQQATPLGKLSRNDVQNLIASSIQQGR
jgi:DNA repair exonuclease SbcCD ATPase subunit